jgi:RHS repeat-associated protein
VAIDEVGVGGPAAAGVGQPVPRAWFAYDDAGNLVKAVDALGGVATYAYDSFHRVTKQTDARGYYYSFKYDVWGRCIRAGGMDGLWACRVEYFTEQGFTRYTEGDDATWEYHYEKDGFVTKIVDPYGGVKRRERDAEGRVVREIDSGGRAMRWLYDAEGAHHARVDDYGHLFPPELERPRLPDPFEQKLPRTALERQFAGLVEGRSEAAVHGGSPVLFGTVPVELSDWVRANFRLRPPLASLQTVQVQREKDVLGRIVHEIDAWGRRREWRYDATGNVVAELDRDGRVTEYQASSWNLVGEKRDALGNAMRYSYSKTEQIIGVTDPLGNVTQYDYDLKGRLVRTHRHGRLKEEYVYDDGDHFIEKRDGNGNVLFTSAPHPNHRVGKRVLASGGFHKLDYDARGRVAEASTEAHEVLIGYDAFGRRVHDLRDGRGVRCRFVHERYTASYERRVLDHFATKEELHIRGHSTITDPAGRQTMVRWDETGMVMRRTCAGTIELSQYDHEGRLENQIVCWSQRGVWQSLGLRYAYTADGDLVSVSDSRRGVTTYEVDAAHRLAAEILPDGSRLEYELDAAGNVLAKPGLERAEIEPGNRITATEDEVFYFDDRNHVALRRLRDGAGTRYVYDSFDMLVRVERTASDGSPMPALVYEYDALGRRCSVNGGVDREFFWEGDRLAAEVLADGRLRVYEYAGRDALVPIGFTEHAGVDADPSSGKSFSVFSNPVGMPLHIEDDAGEIVWWATRIDPYGRIDVHSDSRIEYNLRWPGHYHDAETGLHYNRHRYYDPRLGCYLQSDPLGYKGSEVNLYGYAPNPLVQVDVLGLQHPGKPGDESSSTKGEGEGPPERIVRPAGDSETSPVTGKKVDGASEVVEFRDADGNVTARYYVDDQGRTVQAEGLLDPPESYTKKGVGHIDPEGYESGRDHRGHLIPERSAADQDSVNQPENVIAEHGRESNLSPKKQWENQAQTHASQDPGSHSVHQPHYDGDDPRPTSVSHDLYDSNGNPVPGMNVNIPNPD